MYYGYRNLRVLKQIQVELELLEVKLAQKSVAVAQERENNMPERQCVSITTTCTFDLVSILLLELLGRYFNLIL